MSLRMMVRTRFAPSPTGRLHLGHAFAARVAWELAGQTGEFLLRHEDIDGPRVREEFYRGIEEDLLWLGFPWCGTALRQTSRLDAYEAALERLKSGSLVYPCFCTRREIQEEWTRMAAAPQGSGTSVYPGTCLNLTSEEVAERLESGQPHAWRLDTRKAIDLAGPLNFHDLRFGEVAVDASLSGDVVLARKDIGTAYHLAVVVDDAFQQITHVTRGEDLLESTHVHRLLQKLLGLPEPVYHHHRLIRDAQGKRLAKRDNSLAVATLRERGMTAARVLALIR